MNFSDYVISLKIVAFLIPRDNALQPFFVKILVFELLLSLKERTTESVIINKQRRVVSRASHFSAMRRSVRRLWPLLPFRPISEPWTIGVNTGWLTHT